MMKIDYKLVLDLIWSIFLLSVIGILFVGFSIFLGKYELLSVAFVLVLATNVRSFIPQKLRIACESIPVLGEGLEIFNQLETYYVQYRPRSPFYYILYPITSILGFVKGGERAQRELAAYFYLIRWIVLLLVIESADLYLDLSQQFNWFFSFKWLYLELLCLYFLSNFFMIPLSTSSLSLSVSQKRVRLSILSVMTLMMLTGFTYFMSTHGGYYGVVPQNIVLEKRFSTLMPTQGVQTFSFQSKSKETHAVKAVEEQSSTHKKKQAISLHSSFFMKSLKEQPPFFRQVEREIVELLGMYLPLWHSQHMSGRSIKEQHVVLAEINTRLQERLRSLSVFDEHELFYLSLSQSDEPLWGFIALPFRESILYFFKYDYDHEQLTLYDSWQQLTATEQKHVAQMWEADHFRFNDTKRLAQLVTQYVTKQVESELVDIKQKHLPKMPSTDTQFSQTKKKTYTADEETSEEIPDYSNLKLPRKPKYAITSTQATTDQNKSKTPPPSKQTQTQMKTQMPKPFMMYDKELQSFDYQRALTQQLLRDHMGEMPVLAKRYWTVFYEYFLACIFWMFKLSMPIHILLIIYCKLRWHHEPSPQET